MYSYIEGIITEKTPTIAILNVGGIGYEIHISLTSYEQLGNINEKAKLYTHLHVRDDAHLLFGFYSREERKLFLQLISISGVGPRLAQSILSGIKISELKRAIIGEDIQVLTSITGVGKKTAQRLIVELKERIEKVEKIHAGEEKTVLGITEEAMLALVSLGYNKSVAERSIKKVLNESEKDITIEALIKRALRHTN